MLLSRKGLQRVLGVIWLIDGLLQLQPQMFTANMINGIMRPILQGQPGFLESMFKFIVNTISKDLTAINLLITVVQVLIGLGFLFLSDRWIKDLVIASFVWALIVWFGGEGMSMLLTGAGSVLTGAPGAVLLYPLLGLAVCPRTPAEQPAAATTATGTVAPVVTSDDGLLTRRNLRWVLSGFWFFAALLQLQPYWWQAGQISGVIGSNVGAGGLNGALVDHILTPVANATANSEIPLNILLILVFLALGIGFALPTDKYLQPFLIASVVMSVLIWYFGEAFGMILTGMATDFNSGLLLIVMTLAVWPRPGTAGQVVPARSLYDAREAGEVGHEGQVGGSGSTQRA
ncbi:MAG: hypothetical protein ACLQUY_21510 [Ktedonobacterales bacterium]